MGDIGGVTPIRQPWVTKGLQKGGPQGCHRRGDTHQAAVGDQGATTKTDHMGVIGGVTPIRRPWVTEGLQKGRPHGCHRRGDTHQEAMGDQGATKKQTTWVG